MIRERPPTRRLQRRDKAKGRRNAEVLRGDSGRGGGCCRPGSTARRSTTPSRSTSVHIGRRPRKKRAASHSPTSTTRRGYRSAVRPPDAIAPVQRATRHPRRPRSPDGRRRRRHRWWSEPHHGPASRTRSPTREGVTARRHSSRAPRKRSLGPAPGSGERVRPRRAPPGGTGPREEPPGAPPLPARRAPASPSTPGPDSHPNDERGYAD